MLYTFYPPLSGSPFYYIGILIAVIGSWIWIGATWSRNFGRWKRDHPGLPVPLAMFATTAGALLWAWTSLGVGSEIIFLILPKRLRLDVHDRRRPRPRAVLLDPARHRLFLADPGLHRVLYAVSAGGRRSALQRQDGAHRLPCCSFSRCRSAFIICSLIRRSAPASSSSNRVHRHGRRADAAHDLHHLRVARDRRPPARRPGLFGWIAALPWDRPFVLASGFSLVMLGLGGAGGLINMSYALNSTVHNTQWVTGHFHLIYGARS